MKKLFAVKFYGSDWEYFSAKDKQTVVLYIIEKHDITEEEFKEDYKILEHHYEAL